MRHGRWALAMLLLAGGCQGEQGDSSPGAATSVPDTVLPETDASEVPSDAPPLATATGRAVEASTELYEFSYAYPDAVGAIPELRDMFDARLAQARTQLASAARDDRKMAQAEGYPFNPHGHDANWAAAADLPDWLSLSAQIYTFAGGAHGMITFDSLLWDRRTANVRKPRDLFAKADALRSAIREPFCNALDRERAKRRGEPVNRDSEQLFSECIDPVAQTLILGSANGRTFDRIGVLVAPYEAGPYAEGAYEVTLPVTAAVMAVVKPQYRASFSIGS